MCYLFFDDVEKGHPNCIRKTEADHLKHYLMHFKKIPDNIIVHCGAGISRSSGLAAALLKYFTGDDSQIFDNPKYTPNMTVYRTVLETFMEESLNEKEIEEKEKHNIEIWKQANDID